VKRRAQYRITFFRAALLDRHGAQEQGSCRQQQRAPLLASTTDRAILAPPLTPPFFPSSKSILTLLSFFASLPQRSQELQPFCFFCDREFDNEAVLIQHQKARHFKCHVCHKKMATVNSLNIHLVNVHKETLKRVPNAKEGRDSLDFGDIYGMEYVPQEYLVPGVKRQRVHGGDDDGEEDEAGENAGGGPSSSSSSAAAAAAGYPPGMPMPPGGMMMGPGGMLMMMTPSGPVPAYGGGAGGMMMMPPPPMAPYGQGAGGPGGAYQGFAHGFPPHLMMQQQQQQQYQQTQMGGAGSLMPYGGAGAGGGGGGLMPPGGGLAPPFPGGGGGYPGGAIPPMQMPSYPGAPRPSLFSMAPIQLPSSASSAAPSAAAAAPFASSIPPATTTGPGDAPASGGSAHPLPSGAPAAPSTAPAAPAPGQQGLPQQRLVWEREEESVEEARASLPRFRYDPFDRELEERLARAAKRLGDAGWGAVGGGQGTS
jgi:hypothetical protein